MCNKSNIGSINIVCAFVCVCVCVCVCVFVCLFEMLNERGGGELRFYDENGNFVESYFGRSGVREGCVLGAFFFFLATYPVYASICVFRRRLPPL